MDTKEIQKRLDKAISERQRLETLFDDAIRLTMPARKRFHHNPVDLAEDIFDETGANGVAEFVSRMQAGLVPPFTEFLQLRASSLVKPADRRAINRDLDEIAKYAFEEIWASNFAQESAESFYDLALSTGCMLVEEGRRTGIHNRAIPVTDIYIERGPDDLIGGVFRSQTRKASDLPYLYPRMFQADRAPRTAQMIVHEKDREVEIIEYTRRDYAAAGDAYVQQIVNKSADEVIYERKMEGRGANPFLTFRWSAAAGETWGRGPLLNAMAAIRTTNLMVELVLENAAMSIVGVYQTDNDGVVNADNIQLLPGTIITKEIGTKGLEQVAGHTGNFNMQDVVLGDQRLNIKRALFNDMLSDPNKTPATATEVAERMADLAHRTAAGFSRVFYEFVEPYMWRVLHILEKRGDIALPVQNRRAIQFHAVSPLAQAQQGRDLQQLVNDFQIRSLVFGPQTAPQMYDMEKLHDWMKAKMGLDEKIYRSAADVVKSMQQQADAMQQTQLLQEAMKRGSAIQ